MIFFMALVLQNGQNLKTLLRKSKDSASKIKYFYWPNVDLKGKTTIFINISCIYVPW